MLESIKALRSWHHKDYKTIYKFWKRGIMKQDDSDGDLKYNNNWTWR